MKSIELNILNYCSKATCCLTLVHKTVCDINKGKVKNGIGDNWKKYVSDDYVEKVRTYTFTAKDSFCADTPGMIHVAASLD